MIRQRTHELKQDRALQHLENLEAEGQLWREGNPYRITHEPDPQTNKKPIRLIIGDSVHNLRSALDNLAYALSEAYRGYVSNSRVDTTLMMSCVGIGSSSALSNT
jgi:hypothetical protein